MAEVHQGIQPTNNIATEVKTKYPFLSIRNFINGKIIFGEKTKYLKEEKYSSRIEKILLREGDIIVFLNYNLGSMYTYTNTDPQAILGKGMALLRSSLESGEYIKSYLSYADGRDILSQQVNMKAMGSVVRSLSVGALKAIKIPIIPLDKFQLNRVSDRNIENADTEELKILKNELYRVIKTIENKASEIIEFSQNRFDQVESKLNILEAKLDEVIQAIRDLTGKFKDIKSLPREDEEKLHKIYRLIDSKLELITSKKNLDEYEEDVKYWFEYWDFLDEASKSFLPSAEYLFDELSNLGTEDYSPFIIQYCRALENELLKKLFENYHDDIKSRLNADQINNLIRPEIENDNSKANTFAIFILKENRKYTMGQMSWILNLTKAKGSTLASSELIQDFRNFVLKYYKEKVIEKSYLNKIETITKDFRNKSAHPYIMGLEIAKECQLLVREGLNYFFYHRL